MTVAALTGERFSMICAGIVLALGGFTFFVRAHRAGCEAFLLAGARISRVSLMVIGLALLGVSYHLVTHGAGIEGFRAPLWLAAAVAAVAVALSLMTDRLEQRGRRDGGD